MSLPRVVIEVGSETGPTPLDGPSDLVVRTPVGSRALAFLPPPGEASGQQLFDALLGPLWADIRQLPEVLERRGVELALDLPLDLHGHLWEAMHDGERPLGANPGLLVAITRRVASDVPPPGGVAGAPRVLFASGAKLTEQVILPGAMFLGLLRECESEGLALARVADDLNTDTLARRCEDFRPHLVHLVAHGRLDEDGELLVELSGTPVRAAQLVAALLPGDHRPLAVVLSVCHTARPSPASLATELIGAGVPIVVAMDGEVAEPACRLFSKRLVRALLNGDGVAEAAAHGRRAALVGEPDPGARDDWARPTVYTAASLPESFRPVDPAPARAVLRWARQLELVQHPVYIGRRAIFDQVDRLLPGGPGLLVAYTEGGFTRLGATRLLRETGFRLLHAGHVPLLLAPHNQHTAPRTLRQAVAGVLKGILDVCDRLGLPSEPLATVGGLRRAIVGFRDSAEPLDLDVVRELLAQDLATLARAAGERLGPPYGEHTRVVVLAEGLHLWLGALGWIEAEPPGLLNLITPNGLGTAACPVPVVATAALDQCVPLSAFKAERPGLGAYRFEPLTALPDDEAMLGYQWVLLQPWHPDAHYRKVWVAAPGHDREALRATFSKHLRGQPAGVADTLYLLVDVLAEWKHFIAHDDEAAWRVYAELNRLAP